MHNIYLFHYNLIFYLYSGIFNFCLLIFTILFNYFYIKLLGKKYQRSYNVLVIINILFLSFFKYTNYFIFPLGISFYTFNNISYILDRKHNKIKNEEECEDFISSTHEIIPLMALQGFTESKISKKGKWTIEQIPHEQLKKRRTQ